MIELVLKGALKFILVDDREANIRAAEECGWHAVHYNCTAETRGRIVHVT